MIVNNFPHLGLREKSSNKWYTKSYCLHDSFAPYFNATDASSLNNDVLSSWHHEDWALFSMDLNWTEADFAASSSSKKSRRDPLKLDGEMVGSWRVSASKMLRITSLLRGWPG